MFHIDHPVLYDNSYNSTEFQIMCNFDGLADKALLKKKAKKKGRAAVKNALNGVRPKTRYKDNFRD